MVCSQAGMMTESVAINDMNTPGNPIVVSVCLFVDDGSMHSSVDEVPTLALTLIQSYPNTSILKAPSLYPNLNRKCNPDPNTNLNSSKLFSTYSMPCQFAVGIDWAQDAHIRKQPDAEFRGHLCGAPRRWQHQGGITHGRHRAHPPGSLQGQAQ